jgi:hypothetical protein
VRKDWLFRERKIDMNFLKILMIFVLGCCSSSESEDQSFSWSFLMTILFCCMGLFCWSGDSERSSLIHEYCCIEFVAVSGQEIKLLHDDIDENATFFLYFCLDWNYWRLAYFTILGPYVGYACCSGGEIIYLDDLITCSIMSTFVAAGERD